MENNATGVIVADNDIVVRGLLRCVLVAAGQDVLLAANGQEVLDLASKVRARLVILDLEMPRLNGFIVCQRLRSIPAYETTPIAILSGHDGDESRRAATQVGANLFIGKPFQMSTLLQRLSIYLESDSKRHTVAPTKPLVAMSQRSTGWTQ
ncbi:MAG: hypothetical protein NVSMB18_06570 [Acetobacteraceae bacterium]